MYPLFGDNLPALSSLLSVHLSHRQHSRQSSAIPEWLRTSKMSYPQSSTYTQVAYPPQHYAALPPPNPFHYAAPPPQPVYLDPHMFRRDYMARLANLTVNSRPIIQSLSMIAQDYSRFAEIVVQCVEQHIRRVSGSGLVLLRHHASPSPIPSLLLAWLDLDMYRAAFGMWVPHTCTVDSTSSSRSWRKSKKAASICGDNRARWPRVLQCLLACRLGYALMLRCTAPSCFVCVSLFSALLFAVSVVNRGMLTHPLAFFGLLQVDAWMKLPAFYLLDAISKNVYDPYARQFAVVVAGLYKDTYDVVDQPTRSKMEEMLLTWRTGGPDGRELFGVVPQIAIEGHVWGGGSNSNSVRASPSRAKRRPDRLRRKTFGRGRGAKSQPMVTQARVLSELEFVLGQKERHVQANPYDKMAQNHIAVLQQVSCANTALWHCNLLVNVTASRPCPSGCLSARTRGNSYSTSRPSNAYTRTCSPSARAGTAIIYCPSCLHLAASCSF